MKKVVSFLFPTCLCLLMVTGCSKPIPSENTKNNHASGDMQILIEGQHTQPIVFQLNDSKAARSLYDQLPITLEVEDYNSDEKIFYPEEKLDIHDAPKAKGPAGTLAYYEPWGDVVMYYGVCNGANGLYALGEAISGADQIEHLSGNIRISKVEKLSKKEEETKKADKPQEDFAEIKNTEIKDIDEESEEMSQVNITVGSQSFTASLYDNETVRTFLSQLPLTLPMEDLHGNEKYYYLSKTLPTSSQAVSQIHTGDIELFGNDCLVLFYQDFASSYSYTSLGQIDDPQGLADALGSGNVSIYFELSK